MVTYRRVLSLAAGLALALTACGGAAAPAPAAAPASAAAAPASAGPASAASASTAPASAPTGSGSASAASGSASAASGSASTGPGSASAASGSAAAAAGSAAPASGSSVAASSANAGSLTPITVGYGQDIATNLPLYVAEDAGLSAKDGLKVNLLLTPASTALAAISSGQIQISGTGGSEVLNGIINGVDMVVLANLQPKSVFKLEVPTSIKSADDLRGKKIGITRFGSSTETGAQAALKKLGLDPKKDVTFIQMGTTPALTAGLLSGAVQGAVRSPPDTMKVEQQGFHPLLDLGAAGVPSADVLIAAPRPWLNAHRDLAQKYIDSIVSAIAFAKKDKPATEASLRRRLKMSDPKLLDDTYELYVNSIIPAAPYASPDQFGDAVAAVAATNPKVKNVDLSKIIDSSFLKSAEDRGLAKA